jgi:lipopolysaccharide/colanic/teichoic acid biosynthesis glycosyltransferase
MIKKIFDVIFAVLLLIFFSPIFFVIYVYLIFAIGTPVIFKQTRAGHKGKEFILYKFRTMAVTKNPNILKSSKFERKRVLIRTKFLRATRLDEIPQLINILKGDLSFVGPRPLLKEYIPLYSREQKKRLDVRAGITGWSQIHSKKKLTWKEKFKLDVWYVRNQSFLLDLKIIFLTAIFFLSSALNTEKISFISDKFNGKN